MHKWPGSVNSVWVDLLAYKIPGYDATTESTLSLCVLFEDIAVEGLDVGNASAACFVWRGNLKVYCKKKKKKKCSQENVMKYNLIVYDFTIHSLSCLILQYPLLNDKWNQNLIVRTENMKK